MTGPERRREIQTVLEDSFDLAELARLVRHAFDVKLDVIVDVGQGLGAVVFELLDWAERHERSDELIAAVRRERPKLAARLGGTAAAGPGPEVWIAALPSTRGTTVGRVEELLRLRRCWSEGQVRLVTVVGQGGCGKSKLVGSWLAGLAPGFAGAERVFGWSFYAQGTDRRTAATSDEFFERAFAFFGGGPVDDADALGRARELVTRLQARRTLLVLDGIEPCQDPISGEVVDPALRYLLKDLGVATRGLCVVTTRPPFVAPVASRLVERIDLRRLEPGDGVALLRNCGVRGTDAALRAAAEQFHGHALSLAMLGKYVVEVWDGELGRVDLAELEAEDGNRLGRLLASYDRCFGDARGEVLRAVGLFDRPAPRAEIEWLRAGGTIPGAGDEQAWSRALHVLVKTEWLSRDAQTGALDAHPVIRDHFARAFAAEDGAGFLASHGLLFDRLCASVRDPASAPEIGRLYRAVAHGCRARRWDEAFAVLRDRIRQGKRHVSLHRHGMVAADLAAFACFFSPTWAPVAELSASQRYWLQNSGGVLHRAEGNLEAARRLLKEAVDTARDEGWLERAAESARNLASTESAMGRLAEAMVTIAEAVRLADEAGQVRMRLVCREFHAHMLSRGGRLQEARAMFVEVERLRVAEDRSGELAQYPGGSFVGLLIELGEPEEAVARGRRALERTADGDPERDSLMNIGLAERSLARALAASGAVEEAAGLFAASLEHLRRSGRRDHVGPGLVDRARFLLRRDPEQAARDLEEAREIAGPREFRLVMADIHLTRGRLELIRGDVVSARGSLAEARRLIEDTGFALRVPELLLAEALLAAASGDRTTAEGRRELAERCIEGRGMFGMRAELAAAAAVIEAARA